MSVCTPQAGSLQPVRTAVEEGGAERPVQRCVCLHAYDVCASRVTPHPRQEGPLSETVDLPTCRVFAKTKIAKDTSTSSSGAQGERWPPRPGGLAFLLCSQTLKKL